MVTKNISIKFQHPPIKTVGGVRKSMQVGWGYLTSREKIQNSAALRFCVWLQRTSLCIFNTLLSKLWSLQKYEKVAQMTSLSPLKIELSFFNLESYAWKLLFPICIHHFNFMMIESREDT